MAGAALVAALFLIFYEVPQDFSNGYKLILLKIVSKGFSFPTFTCNFLLII